MMKIFLFLALLPLSFKAYCVDSMVTARPIFVSSSEKSLALDIGSNEDCNEGNYAYLLIQRGSLDRPKLFLVGAYKVIKSFPSKCYLLQQKSYIKNKVVVDEKVIVLFDSKIKIGRETNYNFKKVIYNKDEYLDANEFAQENSENIPDKLIAFKNKFERSEKLLEDDQLIEYDKELVTYDTYKAAGSKHFSDDYLEEIKGLTYLLPSKYEIGNIKKVEDLKLLNSDTSHLIKKINSQRYGLMNGIYKDSRRSDKMPEFQERMSLNNAYQLEQDNLRKADVIDPSVLNKMKNDGDLWSSDYDAKALRRYFVSTGLMREKMRREAALSELDAHEIMLLYTGNMQTHVANSDIDPNYQSTGYNLSLSYDLHLFKVSPDLINWSLQFLAERGVSYYDLTILNGRSEEGVFGLYVNYYFLNNPNTVHAFIGEIGAGMKFGVATMGADQLSTSYSYSVLTAPAFQLLTKYRFKTGDETAEEAKIGFSFNGGLIYEMKSLKIMNSPVEKIKTNINVSDLKYTLGMSIYY